MSQCMRMFIGLAAWWLTTAASYGQALEGTIKVDGSSTVFPISEAIAEEFQRENPKVRITLGVSGTGGGYKKFIAGETAINNASRLMSHEEVQAARGKIEFIEIPIAYDGLSIVVNPQNHFVQSLTKAQLKRLWEPNSTVKTWKDLDHSWPAETIKLYGPGPDSGTFDYFTETVMGKARASRSDYTASENDNALIMGLVGDKNALGYFGYAHYANNAKKLKIVAIDDGRGAIAPSEESVQSGRYPLSRPVFIAINKKESERKEVDAFVKFYLHNIKNIAREIGYMPLPNPVFEQATKRYQERQTGSWPAPH